MVFESFLHYHCRLAIHPANRSVRISKLLYQFLTDFFGRMAGEGSIDECEGTLGQRIVGVARVEARGDAGGVGEAVEAGVA